MRQLPKDKEIKVVSVNYKADSVCEGGGVDMLVENIDENVR